MDLTGTVAIVTGSGRGPGLAPAAELARCAAAGVRPGRSTPAPQTLGRPLPELPR